LRVRSVLTSKNGEVTTSAHFTENIARPHAGEPAEEDDEFSLFHMGEETDALPPKPKKPYEVVTVHTLQSTEDPIPDNIPDVSCNLGYCTCAVCSYLWSCASHTQGLSQLEELSSQNLPLKDDLIVLRTLTLDVENRAPVMGPWQGARVETSDEEGVWLVLESENEERFVHWTEMQARLKERVTFGEKFIEEIIAKRRSELLAEY
jgi:hypothetical protein